MTQNTTAKIAWQTPSSVKMNLGDAKTTHHPEISGTDLSSIDFP